MRNSQIGRATRLAAGLMLMAAAAHAQHVADPGFKSVGRGAPVVADLAKYERVGPSLRAPLGQGQPGQQQGQAVAPALKGLFSARDGAAPAGVKALPVDIYTSKDFYKD